MEERRPSVWFTALAIVEVVLAVTIVAILVIVFRDR